MTCAERVEEVMASLNESLNDTHDVCPDESLEIGENTTAGPDGREKMMTPDIQADNATEDQETELLYYKYVNLLELVSFSVQL